MKTIEQVKDLLAANKDDRGIRHWESMQYKSMSSYGIGLTRLKKLARQVGRSHELAQQLWKCDVFDLKIISVLIEEYKKVTRQQVEAQVKDTSFWMLSHSYCQSLLSKVSFQQQLMEEWVTDDNDLRRRCGFACLYNIAKDNKKLPDEYFEPYLNIIKDKLQQEENFVKDAMNNALFMIGNRNAQLNKLALQVAQSIGRVEVDYGDNSCQAIDCVTRLSKLGEKW